MKNLTAYLLLFFAFHLQLSAQKIEEWVNERKPLLFEKLYLHIDREIYAPGDKIWLKAYQVNGITHELNSNFRNIFVQLVAENGQVVRNILLFSIKGQAQGNLNTDSLSDGGYTIRAFTKYLENFGEDACFHKKIWIRGTKQGFDSPEKERVEISNTKVDFLPEGGLMVLNAPNTVAFKAIDEKGRGVEVSGHIIDDLGDTITSFKSAWHGMGKLSMMPTDERSYYAVIDQIPDRKIKLASAVADGITLSCKDNGESLRFTLSANMKKQAYQPFYFMASRKGTVIWRKIQMNDYTYALNLSKDLFPEGITKITLLDTLKQPFAERLIYVNKGEKDLISLQLNKKEFKPRDKVTIDTQALLAEGDSITSPLSVTVVNQNYLGQGGNSQTIKSYLLLDSELKGGIESPASFFTDQDLPSAQKLDLLMMVNGWRTYLWDDVMANQASVDDWNDAGIEIKGYVKRLLWNKPLPEVQVSLSYVFKNYEIGKTISDDKGRFKFERIFFQDSTELMLNGITKNRSHSLEIILDESFNNYPKLDSSALNRTVANIPMNTNFYLNNLARQQKEIAFNPEKGIILLDQVDIVSDSKAAFSRSLGEYPWADRTFKVKPEDNHYHYLVDYLLDKIPSLVYSIDTFTMANRPVDFLIDNLAPMDLRQITLMRMDNVNIVDVLNPGFRRTNPGELGAINPNGLIAIYSKDPNKVPVDYTNVRGRIRPSLRGYHKPVKFYSPTYTPDNIDSPQPDYRPTLLWNPDLSLKDGKASVEFFTSDESAHYVVYVEGVTKNGKICYGTTEFTVGKK
ncbi:MAG: hypothetical protein ACM3P1_11750 [Candidatus Saccharibacteria bacterium]